MIFTPVNFQQLTKNLVFDGIEAHFSKTLGMGLWYINQKNVLLFYLTSNDHAIDSDRDLIPLLRLFHAVIPTPNRFDLTYRRAILQETLADVYSPTKHSDPNDSWLAYPEGVVWKQENSSWIYYLLS